MKRTEEEHNVLNITRSLFIWVTVVLLLLGCTTVPADPQSAWKVWADASRPDAPVIELRNSIPSTLAESTLYVEALSSTATKWQFYLDGVFVSEPVGPSLSVGITLSDGNHSIRIVAISEVWPSNEALIAFGPVSSSAEIANEILVDTTPPVFSNLTSYPGPDGKTIVIVGSLSDATSGACCVSVGNSEVFDVNTDGTFQVSVSVEEVGVATSITVAGLDRLRNVGVSQVGVTLPPNRWERVDSQGNWIDVNVIPGFDPFDIEVVGIGQVLEGYDGDYWIQYVNNVPVGVPRREPKQWGEIKTRVTVVGAGLGVILLLLLIYWSTSIQRSLGKVIGKGGLGPPVSATALQTRNDPRLIKEVVQARLFVQALRMFLEKLGLAQSFVDFISGEFNFKEKYKQMLASMGLPPDEEGEGK